jgi:FkbM family methyltransferase
MLFEKVKKMASMEHESKKMIKIINRLHVQTNIEEIWEIGSRDGLDSQKLSETFPMARIVAFEPNLETFELVKQVAMNSFGKISAFNLALSDVDGRITFYKIDTHSTITSWPDGNPGASSIFVANNISDIEKYVQIPVEVMANRAKTLIQEQRVVLPNLVWIDAQGAEGKILKGFEETLSSVDFIYVELSLVELYLGQPLASEIVELLSRNFYWHSNLSRGYLQFDAFFVNKKHGRLSVKIRDWFFRLSLQTELYLGIRYSALGFVRKIVFRLIGRLHFRVINVFRKSESRFLGRTMLSAVLTVWEFFRIQRLPTKLRQLIGMAQPSAPLRDVSPPVIDIAIPCHQKDWDNLELVIYGVRSSVINPIGKIRLITPSRLVAELKNKFPDCDVVTDESVVDVELISMIDSLVPNERKGWVLQQIIKFKAVLLSEEVATLILDADTILLNRKIWLDSDGRQLLCVGDDYYWPYKHHQRRVFGGRNHLLSFVTHSQLMKKGTLCEMFGSDGRGLLHWLREGDFSESSPVSEYDTYGEWISSNKRDEVVFAKWNNIPLKIDPKVTSYAKIIKEYGKYGSVSNHSYLE